MRYVRIIIGLLVLTPVILFGLEAYAFKTGDSIQRAGIETRWLLRNHRVFDRSEELRKWLTSYHGEAPGSEVMAVMVSWCISNKAEAELLFSGFNQTESASLAKRLVASAYQSGKAKQFRLTFKDSRVPALLTVSNE